MVVKDEGNRNEQGMGKDRKLPIASGGGGSLAYVRDVALTLVNCRVTSNIVSVPGGGRGAARGGGIVATQFRIFPPSNLLMDVKDINVTPFRSCVPRFGPSHFRLWDAPYYNPGILLRGCVVDGNAVMIMATPSGGGGGGGGGGAGSFAVGGGIMSTRVDVTISGGRVRDNDAGSGEGGAVYLDTGSAKLTITSGAVLSGNRASNGGGAIYSASGGAIYVQGSTVAIGSQPDGVVVVRGGDVQFSGGTCVQCSAGEQLRDAITFTTSSLSEWKIDCNTIIASKLSKGREQYNFTFTNPTCEQLGSPRGVLNGEVDMCLELPLQPPVNQSTGTISCTACTSGMYSVQVGRAVDGTIDPVFKCRFCPFGARCEAGGADVRATLNYWGTHMFAENEVADTGTGALIPTTEEVLFYPCPLNYCCDDNAKGCSWQDPSSSSSSSSS
jgi:hypothetical protein